MKTQHPAPLHHIKHGSNTISTQYPPLLGKKSSRCLSFLSSPRMFNIWGGSILKHSTNYIENPTRRKLNITNYLNNKKKEEFRRDFGFAFIFSAGSHFHTTSHCVLTLWHPPSWRPSHRARTFRYISVSPSSVLIPLRLNNIKCKTVVSVRIINKPATILVLKSARKTTSNIFNFPTSHN